MPLVAAESVETHPRGYVGPLSMSYPQLEVYPQAGVVWPGIVAGHRYYSNMRSSSREEIVEVFDALEADFKRARDLSFDALTTP